MKIISNLQSEFNFDSLIIGKSLFHFIYSGRIFSKIMNKSVSFGMKDFLDFIPDMACIVDETGKIIDCNNIQASKLGYSKNELIGKLGFDLISDEDKKYGLKEFEKLKHQDRVENIELWGLRKNGKYRALTTTSKIPYPDGTTKYLIITKDITQSYIQQKKLKQIKENFASLGELTSKIAHDIRNPLSVIKNHIYFIDQKIDDHTIKERLQSMDSMVSEINFMVSDIANYTKTQSSQKQKIDSEELMRITLHGISIPKNIQLKHTGKNIPILCDKSKLSVVLRNLITNSIDAIQEEGTIAIEFSEDNNSTIIKLIDSGTGIPDDDVDKIFDLLFTTKSNGTGLGLSICKNIVTSHGGTINFSNNPTTFTIKIPKN